MTELESREIAAELIQDVGSYVLSDDSYSGRDWDAISIVATIEPGRKNYTGYVYLKDEFSPETPDQTRPLSKLLIQLQEAMRSPKGEVWKQALIHITRPGPEINVQFEYDDPKRWALKKVSLDMSDYANSLRPPSKAPAEN